MSIFLPFIKSPKETLKLSVITLHGITKEQILESNPKKPKSGIVGFELMQLFSVTKNEQRWTVLETDNTGIPNDCYGALFELLTDHWTYILKREERIHKSFDTVASDRYPTLPHYTLNKLLTKNVKQGVELLLKERQFRVSLLRWNSSYLREDPLDTILDCCAALEAAFRISDELRLRISLSVYHILNKHKREGFLTVYKMYGIRNSFIHGEDIPTVTKQEQKSYITIVAYVLSRFVVLGKIPKGQDISLAITRHYENR
jgi:hypothetical protein